jgi:hypothetical protein
MPTPQPQTASGNTYYIVYGTTEPQDFQLTDDGENLVGTSLTIGIVVYRGTTLVVGISVAWLDQANGTVRVTGVESLAADEYQVRYTLTDSGGKVGLIPSGRQADRWLVVPVAA